MDDSNKHINKCMHNHFRKKMKSKQTCNDHTIEMEFGHQPKMQQNEMKIEKRSD